jgi:hypothetical protein
MRTFKLVAIPVFSLSMLCAQNREGSLSGTVRDPRGVAAKNVTVQAKNAATGNVFKATTAADGKYVITNLPSGRYDVTVNVPGLRVFDQKGIEVAGKPTAFDINLEEGTQLSTLGEDTLALEADRKRHNPPSGPAPRTADGKPDFSGVWWQPAVVDPGNPEWLPNAVKIQRERAENNRKDSPQAHCLPSAILRRGPLHEFVQSKNILVEISDDDSPGFHQIYLSRSNHPKDPDPLWYGDSIGKWEGDTLVVDRVNFEDAVWLDQDGHPHSDKLHIVERYRRPDLGHLEAEITVEDPGVLAKPWTLKRVSDLANEEIREFMCAENNKDIPHMLGK